MLVLKVNLLALNHSQTRNSSWVALLHHSAGLDDDICNVVSSAKSKVNRRFEQLGRSLIRIRNKIGPKIDPCGTPQVILRSDDEVALT